MSKPADFSWFFRYPTPDFSEGACSGHEYPDLWFPEKFDVGRNATNAAKGKVLSRLSKERTLYLKFDAQIKMAKTICHECPIRQQCLEWALKNKEFGIWGETTTNERRTLRSLLQYVDEDDESEDDYGQVAAFG